ncbi:MAG: MBL fold metallo-hydrolase [Bacteroidetes bacterium]|nr:MBL fold metallo-hydrolase [Bacteroidota bacterium]
MALFVTSLNSGSNGNCYYVGSSDDAVLVDVGISCRETERRLLQLNLDILKVRAIFISHEHDDHIKGVSKLANKYNLPVYITPLTAKHGPYLIKRLSKDFQHEQPVQVGGLTIIPFSKQHDAADPYSFIIHHDGVTVGVFTDLGVVCKNLTHYFKQCHAAFLESNYDEDLLEKGRYPLVLKNRIRGGLGHLSNRQALELFIAHRPSFMSHLFLSHLSKENNSPELALEYFLPHAMHTQVIIAGRYAATPVYTIAPSAAVPQQKLVFQKPLQLGLFN